MSIRLAAITVDCDDAVAVARFCRQRSIGRWRPTRSRARTWR
jgi:hypothetical protein